MVVISSDQFHIACIWEHVFFLLSFAILWLICVCSNTHWFIFTFRIFTMTLWMPTVWVSPSGKTLAEQIPKSGPSFRSYLPEANRESIFLTPTDQQELRNIMLNIRNSTTGHGRISSKVINPVIETLLPPLTYITNLSFTEGVFPFELKIAQVLPLYKNNDPMLFNNYRPILILPFFSKLFERLMYNRLINFIEKHHLPYQYQFGFRKNQSTFMALLILLEKNHWCIG